MRVYVENINRFIMYSMSPHVWGPPTWAFMHTLASTVKPEVFYNIRSQLLHMCIEICSVLPCPECAQHAKQFWTRVRLDDIITKQDFIHILYTFHNVVNERKKYTPYKLDHMHIYYSRNIIETYTDFAKNFHTHGNLKLINESFYRTRTLAWIKKWVLTHLSCFIIN